MADTTLATFGVREDTISLSSPLDVLNPRCILIEECISWDDVRVVLVQNKKEHPEDRVWIGYDARKSVFQVGRQK